jgi:hypothetical protein
MSSTTVRRFSKKNAIRSRKFVRLSKKDSLPPIYTRRWITNGMSIPQRIVNPSLERVVRLEGVFTNAAPSLGITYNAVALQDGLDYLGSATLRYQALRMYQVRLYVETFPTTTTASAIGCQITDSTSDVTYTDRPVIGSSIAAVGMKLCFETVVSIVSSSSSGSPFTISADLTPSSGSQVRYVCDVWTQFS